MSVIIEISSCAKFCGLVQPQKLSSLKITIQCPTQLVCYYYYYGVVDGFAVFPASPSQYSPNSEPPGHEPPQEPGPSQCAEFERLSGDGRHPQPGTKAGELPTSPQGNQTVGEK